MSKYVYSERTNKRADWFVGSLNTLYQIQRRLMLNEITKCLWTRCKWEISCKHWAHSQDRQCTYNVTMQQVRVVIVGMEMQRCVLRKLWTTSQSQQYKNSERCIKMLLWRIYVTGSNAAHLRLYVMWSMFSLDLNKFCIFLTDLYGSPQYQISHESVHRKPGWHMPSEGSTEGHGTNRRFSRLFEPV